MVTAYFRGHPIYFDGKLDKWKFIDNNDIVDDTGHSRPCGHCGLHGNSSDGEVDPCLGELAGVSNACCGHGNTEESYICFNGGLTIRGFDVEELHFRTFSDEEKKLIREHNDGRRQYRRLRDESNSEG